MKVGAERREALREALEKSGAERRESKGSGELWRYTLDGAHVTLWRTGPVKVSGKGEYLDVVQRLVEEFALPDGETPHLGDVVISVDTARRQAAEFGVPLQDELSHLVVHGILHLLGYDHEDTDDEAVMRAHEDAVLGGAHHH